MSDFGDDESRMPGKNTQDNINGDFKMFFQSFNTFCDSLISSLDCNHLDVETWEDNSVCTK